MLKVRAEWLSQTEPLRGSKSFSDASVATLTRILDTLTAKMVRSEFHRICATQVDATKEGDYDHALVQAFVVRSLKGKDGHALLALLRVNCSSYVGSVPLEFYLADKWPDGFALLFDAYSQSDSARARKDIVFCLGRGFPSLRARSLQDSSFVANAQRWYVENRSRINLNRKYPALSGMDAWDSMHADKNLFLLDGAQ